MCVLGLFSLMISSFIRVATCISTSLLCLILNDTPLYGLPRYIYLFFSWWIFETCYLQLLGIIVLWISMNTFLYQCVFNSYVYIPKGRNAGHMVNSVCLTFWGTAKWSSKIDASFYRPTWNIRGIYFLHIFTKTYVFSLFDYSYGSGFCDFGLHFSND